MQQAALTAAMPGDPSFQALGSYQPAAIANAALSLAPGAPQDESIVAVGDTISTAGQEGFLRGHGTRVVDGQLQATVCGVVQRVSKLVSVVPLKTRYRPELGEVVVGRVTEVASKRWRLDLGARQDAALLLSAVNLPGGVQRRRNAEDELAMRDVYQEGDLISAEVQSLHADGSMALHTRSSKYGKLLQGQLVCVQPKLVKRQKQHFVSLEGLGVDLILGMNGRVWVSAGQQAGSQGLGQTPAEQQQQPVSREQRERVVRVANCIRALERLYLMITPAAILDAYQASLEQEVPLKEMLGEAMLQHLVEAEARRRQQVFEAE